MRCDECTQLMTFTSTVAAHLCLSTKRTGKAQLPFLVSTSAQHYPNFIAQSTPPCFMHLRCDSEDSHVLSSSLQRAHHRR